MIVCGLEEPLLGSAVEIAPVQCPPPHPGDAKPRQDPNPVGVCSSNLMGSFARRNVRLHAGRRNRKMTRDAREFRSGQSSSVSAVAHSSVLAPSLERTAGASVMSNTRPARPISPVPSVSTWSPPNANAREAALRQREQIRQIGVALRRAGFVALNDQARALGLSRSTTWKVLQADHNVSGLHAGLVCHMLAHKDLPPAVRAVLRQYVIEKARGHYGHSLLRRRRFAAHFWNFSDIAAELLKQVRHSDELAPTLMDHRLANCSDEHA
jgi:hypothetical protein